MPEMPIARRQMMAGAAGMAARAASKVRPTLAQSPLAGETIKLVYPFSAENSGGAVTRVLGASDTAAGWTG